MELNPNHPVTQTLHDQWHKIALLLMAKFGENHVVLTSTDLANLVEMFPGDLPAITVCEKEDGIHLHLVARADGERMARQEGGLPQ